MNKQGIIKKISFLAFAAFFALTITSAVSAQVSIGTTGTATTQNFDGLANAGTTNAFTNNATLPGVYSNRTVYIANDGSSTTGALYSYGTVGSTERALGSVASGGTGTVLYGVRYVNNTGATLNSITVTYTGEQWRNGGNTTPQTLAFSYQQATTFTDLTTGTYTDVAALNFTSLVNTATASALDGNLAANRTTLTQTISVTIPAGQELMIRFSDINDTGNDHGLSVDDLSVTAFAPTAGEVSISGRVTAPQTLGSASTLVTLTSMLGNSQTVRTGKTGGYRFSNLAAGETYVLSVTAKGYTFTPQVVTANGDLTEVNFAPQQ